MSVLLRIFLLQLEQYQKGYEGPFFCWNQFSMNSMELVLWLKILIQIIHWEI